MRYLLDSDVVTDLYDKSAINHPSIIARLASLDGTWTSPGGLDVPREPRGT